MSACFGVNFCCEFYRMRSSTVKMFHSHSDFKWMLRSDGRCESVRLREVSILWNVRQEVLLYLDILYRLSVRKIKIILDASVPRFSMQVSSLKDCRSLNIDIGLLVITSGYVSKSYHIICLFIFSQCECYLFISSTYYASLKVA